MFHGGGHIREVVTLRDGFGVKTFTVVGKPRLFYGNAIVHAPIRSFLRWNINCYLSGSSIYLESLNNLRDKLNWKTYREVIESLYQ